MKISKAVVQLTLLVAVLALVAAGTGLFWHCEGEPFLFTTLRGDIVEIYGQGLYRYDTAFKVPILRGTDAVTFFVATPLLIFALALYRRGSLRGTLLLVGMLAYFLYNSSSLALGVAYNQMALVYILYFSASLFAFILAFRSVDLQALSVSISPGLSYRGTSVFLFLAGLSVFVWLIDIVGSLLQNQPPHALASYTTEVTYVIDLGVIAPTAFLAATMLLCRAPLGYLLAAVILTLSALIGVVVVAQTTAQLLAGITLSAVEMGAFVGTFLIMSLFAAWFLISLLRRVSDPAAPR